MSRLAITITLLSLLLVACGRPLSQTERKFATTLFGAELSANKVRVASFTALSTLTSMRTKRPRTACRERIWPEPTTEKVTTFTAAFVLFNRINIAANLYRPDYLPKYPSELSLPAAMLIAHELTHVWQWQNRKKTGYSPLKAAREHRPGADPYLLNLSSKSAFLDFPFEQQSAIVEEYVCCQNLDPSGGRTKRLHEMLKTALPIATIGAQISTAVTVPWSGVERAGICA
ncbi:MAG: hypothetical protein GXP05_09580 [Alphaproteobacteria bacterium]|nr:hypothetical protein [Alphaproteobacteria bacterium]